MDSMLSSRKPLPLLQQLQLHITSHQLKLLLHQFMLLIITLQHQPSSLPHQLPMPILSQLNLSRQLSQQLQLPKLFRRQCKPHSLLQLQLKSSQHPQPFTTHLSHLPATFHLPLTIQQLIQLIIQQPIHLPSLLIMLLLPPTITIKYSYDLWPILNLPTQQQRILRYEILFLRLRLQSSGETRWDFYAIFDCFFNKKEWDKTKVCKYLTKKFVKIKQWTKK